MSYEINSRHNDLARAMLALVGKSNPLTLGTDIHGVVVLEGERAERSFAAGERYWAGHLSIAAGGAGVRSEALIRNPPNSGVLVTVLYVNGNPNLVVGYVDGTALPAGFGAALGVIQVTDLRWRKDPATAPIPTANVHSKNTLAATAIRELGRTFLTSAALGERGHVAILPPGGALAIMGVADNAAVDITFFGREVPFAAAGLRG